MLLLCATAVLTVSAMAFQVWRCGVLDAPCPLTLYLCLTVPCLWSCFAGLAVCKIVNRAINAVHTP